MKDLLTGLFLGGVFFIPCTYFVMRQRGLEGHWRVVRQYMDAPFETLRGLEAQLRADAKRLADEMED